FATLPPEINSGRMYEGPGSASMIEAVTAWEQLAIRLCTAAADYGAVTSKLAAGCGGPASTAMTAMTAMTAATAPYIDWLHAAAAHAEQAATQAKAAVSAHETALAAIVPPPATAANPARPTWLGTADA